MTHKWINRIVSNGEADPNQLLANPYNWRIHTAAQQETLEEVLDQVGWVQQVIVNQRTGHLVDGHLRVTLALRREEKSVPVIYVDLSEEEEKIIIATLDPITGMAGTDAAKLGELLNTVDVEGDAITKLLLDMADKAGIAWGNYGLVEDAEPQFDKAAELVDKYRVREGSLYGFGKFTVCPKCKKVHRLK
jgi:hypothetical protein